MTQRLRSSWTSWRLRATSRRLTRAEQRLTLLQLETDSQHLRIKELTQREQQLLHRQRETQEQREWRASLQQRVAEVQPTPLLVHPKDHRTLLALDPRRGPEPPPS